MISKTINDTDKKYFMKNNKAKIILQKLTQTEKQLDMLIVKRNNQLSELFTLMK